MPIMMYTAVNPGPYIDERLAPLESYIFVALGYIILPSSLVDPQFYQVSRPLIWLPIPLVCLTVGVPTKLILTDGKPIMQFAPTS